MSGLQGGLLSAHVGVFMFLQGGERLTAYMCLQEEHKGSESFNFLLDIDLTSFHRRLKRLIPDKNTVKKQTQGKF